MNENRQYLIVGLFVVITTAILVGVWLWFSANNRKTYNTYQVVFNEPVDGISMNSIVKYNGVEIGKVKGLELDKNNQRNVVVYLNILSQVPINSDTYATIKPQGVTGMSLIALSLTKNSTSTTNLTPHNTPPYPSIAAHTSLLFGLTEHAQSITSNVQDVSSQVKILLSDQNVEHLSNTLANLDKVSASVAAKSTDIEKAMDGLVAVLQNIKTNSVKLNETFENMSDLTKSLSKTSDNTNNLILGLQDNTMQNVNTVLLPNINQTVIHLNQATAQLEQFLTLLNQNPSAMVRGKVPAAKGPGE